MQGSAKQDAGCTRESSLKMEFDLLAEKPNEYAPELLVPYPKPYCFLLPE